MGDAMNEQRAVGRLVPHPRRVAARQATARACRSQRCPLTRVIGPLPTHGRRCAMGLSYIRVDGRSIVIASSRPIWERTCDLKRYLEK